MLTIDKAEAVSFRLTTIADTNTAVPGGTGTFTQFGGVAIEGGSVPAIDANGNVVFRGSSANAAYGIYTSIGGVLSEVVTTNATIPGTSQNFQLITTPVISNGDVVFPAFGALDSGVGGIYTNIGGGLNVVADTNTPIPDGTGNFPVMQFLGTSIDDDGNVAIGSRFNGIYTFIDNTLTTVANTSTAIPGGTGNFERFGAPSIDDGLVAFRVYQTTSSFEAIYTNLTGTLTAVVDTNTAIPEGTGNFKTVGNPSLDNSGLAFLGTDSADNGGIYESKDGLLELIANTETVIPGRTDTFFAFSNPTYDDGNVAFLGFGEGGFSGIYTNLGGTLTKIFAQGDVIDGKTIAGIFLGSQAIDENRITFNAIFTDGSEGIYVVTAVPESSTVLGTVALGACGVGMLLKRKLNNAKIS